VTIKLQFMIEDPKTLPTGYTRLQFFDPFALEFHNFATEQADEVVVVFARGLVLKKGQAIPKAARGSPSALGHQLQRAVDRGIPNPGIFLPNPLVELLHTQMGTRFHEYPHNLLPLAGEFETALSEKAVKLGATEFSHGQIR